MVSCIDMAVGVCIYRFATLWTYCNDHKISVFMIQALTENNTKITQGYYFCK